MNKRITKEEKDLLQQLRDVADAYGGVIPMWSPIEAYGAAAKLQELLKQNTEDKDGDCTNEE